mmetsp:Transcript_26674/g.89764  ORF Transcript_26674/g.89764 Transcript_26674/m.89764 type:complete len:774 (+) Transcript_26674:79-2400(+)
MAHSEEYDDDEYQQICDNFRLLRRKYDALKRVHRDLLWCPELLEAKGWKDKLPATLDNMVETSTMVNDIELGRKLGDGSFSSVFEGRWVQDGRPCALKRIKKAGVKRINELQNIAAEHEALASLSGGPNMLELQASFASTDHIYIVMEHFGVELYAHMKLHATGLPREFTAAVVYGVANALAYMHGLSFVHRDIKPENVLVEVKGYSFQDVLVKLCDLGLCARSDAPPRDAERPPGGGLRPTNEGTEAHTDDLGIFHCAEAPRAARMFQCCGSMGFFAPEMLAPEGYDGSPADMWSLGCLALEATIGSPAFATFWFSVYKDYFYSGNGERDGEFHAALHPAVEAIAEAARAKKLEVQRARSMRGNTLLQQAQAEVLPAPSPTSAAAAPPRLSFDEKVPAAKSHETVRSKLDNACVVSALIASCLTFDMAARPRAFEARDVLSACRYAAQRSSWGGGMHASPKLALATSSREFDKMRSHRGRRDFSRMRLDEEAPSLRDVDVSRAANTSSPPQLLLRDLAPDTLMAASPQHAASKRAAVAGNKMPKLSSKLSLNSVCRIFGTGTAGAAAENGRPGSAGSSPSDPPDGNVLAAAPLRSPRVPPVDENVAARAPPLGGSRAAARVWSHGEAERLQAVGPGGASRRNSNKPKVLIVDDSPLSLKMTSRAVARKFDCEVHTASSAMDALELAQKHDFDTVLTDIIMPYMDGFQLVAALRSREELKSGGAAPRKIFICAITQMADAFDILPHLDVDVVSCKPLDTNLLAQRLTPIRQAV